MSVWDRFSPAYSKFHSNLNLTAAWDDDYTLTYRRTSSQFAITRQRRENWLDCRSFHTVTQLSSVRNSSTNCCSKKTASGSDATLQYISTTSSATDASRLPVLDTRTTWTTAAGPVFSGVQTETENVTVRPQRWVTSLFLMRYIQILFMYVCN